MTISLNLLVLRAERLTELIAFCEALGMRFQRDRHEGGPEHFSARCGEALLEVYAGAADKSTIATRLGFIVDDVPAIMSGSGASRQSLEGAVQVAVGNDSAHRPIPLGTRSN